MAKADRYRFGDIAKEAIANLASGVPDEIRKLKALNQRALLEYQQNQEANNIARERNRILEASNARDAENLANYRNQIAENQKNANTSRMFNIALSGAGNNLDAVASVYDKFNYPDVASKIRAGAVDETATETLVKSYYETTDPSDRIVAAKNALSKLKTTNPNYSAIANNLRKDLSDFNAMNMAFMKDPIYGQMYQKAVNKFNLPNSSGEAFISDVQNIQSMYNKRKGLSVDTITPPAGTTAPPAGATSQDSANDLLSENAFNPDGSMVVSPEEFERIQQSGAFDDAQPLKITTQNVLSGIAEGRITQPEIPVDDAKPQDIFYEGKKITQNLWRELLSQRINPATRTINPELKWMDDYAKRITGRDNVDATFLGSKAGRKFLPVE